MGVAFGRFAPVAARFVALLAPLALAALLAIPADEARADDGHEWWGHYPLSEAAGRNGDLAMVIHLLGRAHGVHVNAKSSSGYTPLHRAVLYDRATIVATLLAAGADVNAKTNSGYTPLHEAAQHSRVAIVARLLAAGADVNARSGLHQFETPLHIAAGDGRATIVATLIAAGADVHAKDRSGSTPLQVAVNPRRYTCCGVSVNPSVVLLLLAAGADVNAENNSGQTPLHDAVQYGRVAIVDTLITAGADVNAKGRFDGETPLHGAALMGKASIVSLLLAAGADVNAKTKTYHGRSGTRYPGGETPLHYAAVSGRVRATLAATLIAALIAAGADVNAKDDNGRTPLRSTCSNYYGCHSSRAPVRAVLIAAGGHLGAACAGAEVFNPTEPTLPCVRGDNPAECERLGGELQAAGGEADRICSGIDINDTFCIIGSVDAFPCAYFFAHVKECNDDHNRPALDPWHCAKQCADGLRARGARCKAE